eukprot:gene23921-28965_t
MGEKAKALLSDLNSNDTKSLMHPNDLPNGTIGQTDKYEWSQGESEIEVFVNLTPFASQNNKLRGRDIIVDLKPKSIRVKILNETVFEGDLEGSVIVDDSTWIIDEIASSIVASSLNAEEDHVKEARNYANPQKAKSTQQVLWITLMKAPNSESMWPGFIKGEKRIV